MATHDFANTSLPTTVAGFTLTTTADTISIGPHVSAIYMYVDDATVAPGVGRASLDGTNYDPVAGQMWELIWMAPSRAADRATSMKIKMSSGTATTYLRVF